MTRTDLVAGRYRRLHRLGAGGTWLAADELLGRRVTVREVHPGDVDRQAVARLDHPGIVHVYDLIEWQGRWYVVTEYIASGSLLDAAPVSHRAAARIGLAALAALRVAHAAGLRHGNLKPGNVLLADDGRVILTDFGGSTPDHPALGATLRGAVDGRPGPLAPAIEALLADEPVTRVAALLRAAATGRAVGVRPAPLPPAAFGVLLGPQPKSRLRRWPRRRALRTGRPPTQLCLPIRTMAGSTRITLAAAAPRTGRLARSTRISVAAATALLIGTTGVALALDAAHRPAVPEPPPPRALCAEQTAAGPVSGTDPADQQYALPPGWLWHRDPAGFVVAVPQGWTRRATGSAACFRDPDGNRFFEVDADAVVGGAPLAHWQAAERTALAEGDLPGYRRVGLATVDLKRGGAGWEFTWQPLIGVRRHERRLLLAMGGDRSYVLAWTTRDGDWATSEPLQQLVLASLS